MESKRPVLYVVVPCYNEREVLPATAPLFLAEVGSLAEAGLVDGEASRVLFVDDGSTDGTWEVIESLARADGRVLGVSLSRNFGHQGALLAGLEEAMGACDAAITADCDGQDDVGAMGEMVRLYLEGFDVVYGVRSSRDSDTALKRLTAEAYYRLLGWLGADVVFNHADYRLMSSRALRGLAGFREANLFLRGLVPLVGFPSATVAYERRGRVAGDTHYPVSKMVLLALDGVTSLSVRPIRLIAGFGAIVVLLSLVGIVWAIVEALMGDAVPGWASVVCVVCFFGGANLFALGVIGEYVGKAYMEAKGRPRYIVAERTGEPGRKDADGEGADGEGS